VGTVIILGVRRLVLPALAAVAVLATACGGGTGADEPAATAGARAVVVTFPVLASVVQEVVGDAAPVVALMPNGADPHEWKPSPKDVEAMEDALLVVANGLDLEEGLEDTLDEVRARGVPVFEAADHAQLRVVGEGEAADAGHDHGTADPHLWMSAEQMALVARSLAGELEGLGLDVGASGAAAVADLEALDAEVAQVTAAVPAERRKLVSGHESLGYFADRYGFELVGTVLPSLSSQAEVAAGDLVELKAQVEAAGVPAIFTELGTPAAVVEVVAAETGADVVELPTHTLPADGSFRTFLLGNASAIVTALQ
jgi:zinc/manganese transport system substrate-binding protein